MIFCNYSDEISNSSSNLWSKTKIFDIFLNFYHFKSSFFTPIKIEHLHFSDQISPKIVFPVENRTNYYFHRIQYIWISLQTKFHLNQTILSFWNKFAQKWYFWSKRENLHAAIKFSIFELVYIPAVILNGLFWVFGQNRTNEHHLRIHYIWISLGITFH